MQYNSWIYLILFLGCTCLLYYVIPIRLRWGVLLAASIVFYLLASRYLILVLAASAISIYFTALAIDKKNEQFQSLKKNLTREERKPYKAKLSKQTKKILAIACVINFGILFFTKYFNFAGTNINLLLERLGTDARIPFLHLLMPLGISFYTLSAISYVTDVNRGVLRAEKNFFKLFLFLIFFPTITEGPISRYGQLGPQLSEGHKFNYQGFCFGVQLILWGLFKKIVLADRLDMFVSSIFDNHGVYSGLPVFICILTYTFQIYMDFSGCIDIVRGSAELFGITLEENFTQPFFAISVNDFWRRWHITLGAWLRDYIFYPISLSRPFQNLSKKSRQHMNNYYAATIPALFALLAVWFGNGIWHGSEWKYIVYGLYYYIIMAAGMLLEPLFVRLINILHLKREQKGYRLWQILRTFCLVNLGMLIFRAKDLKTAWEMFLSLFCPYHGNASLQKLLFEQGLGLSEIALFVISILILIFIGIKKEQGVRIRETIAAKALPIRWFIYIAAFVIVICLGAYGSGFGAVDFIYAQF